MIFFILLVSLALILTKSQDCNTPGLQCSDDESCCGGCCINNICVQDERPCDVSGDLCSTHACPEGTDCIVYHPDDCPGCESYPVCSTFSGKGEYALT